MKISVKQGVLGVVSLAVTAFAVAAGVYVRNDNKLQAKIMKQFSQSEDIFNKHSENMHVNAMTGKPARLNGDKIYMEDKLWQVRHDRGLADGTTYEYAWSEIGSRRGLLREVVSYNFKTRTAQYCVTSVQPRDVENFSYNPEKAQPNCKETTGLSDTNIVYITVQACEYTARNKLNEFTKKYC